MADGANEHVPLAGRKGMVLQREERPMGNDTLWTNLGSGLTGLIV
ncbi:hypothetical protein OAA11_00730 [Schleiferiaceae bacterium]|nr:hypothetical protein [Schleiferiaceae bacterium]